MNTRKKNKTTHPGIPDMTPSQFTSAGLPPPKTARRSSKKLTKDQQIAALKDQLCTTQELVLSVSDLILHHLNPVALTPNDSPEPGGQKRYADVT